MAEKKSWCSTAASPSSTIICGALCAHSSRKPTEVEYEGTADPGGAIKTGLKQFEDLEDISIVAAPGSTFGYENGYQTHAQSIASLMIGHAERMRYRIAVLDSGDGQSISQVRAMRARYDSKYAALYCPWIRVLDPLSQREINVPPSGFVAGIYARNDLNCGVHKAPANEVVNLAIGFEQFLNESQQDALDAEGINCFRFAACDCEARARSALIPNGSTSTCGATSPTSNTPSTTARNGRCSNRMANSCGPTCDARSRIFFSTNGEAAACSVTRRGKLISSSATARLCRRTISITVG